MNKTERQLAIILELQRNKALKAEDLAFKLETSVRTIYRDIQALSEAGVPLIGTPGFGYSLIEGYFLPPVNFTVEEAVSLLIGADFIEQRFDNQYSQNARSSRAKLEAVLPEPIRNESERVRKNFRLRIHPLNPEIEDREKTHIETIRTAILNRRKIRFKYLKGLPEADGNRETIRTVAPLGLVLVQEGWLLVANCDLREDRRHFLISRMSELTIVNDSFEMPDDFNLQEYRPPDDRKIRIRALFNIDIADKVKESNIYYMEKADLRADGYYVDFRVREPEELLQWILRWGSDVVILEPESFRVRVKEEIKKMLKRY